MAERPVVDGQIAVVDMEEVDHMPTLRQLPAHLKPAHLEAAARREVLRVQQDPH
jgi:hypothetical protein